MDAFVDDPLDLGDIVAVLAADVQHLEAALAHSGDDGASVPRKLIVANVKYAAVFGEAVACAFAVHAHAESVGARLDGASQHQTVARLKDVQWTRRERQRQGAHKYGHLVVISLKN